MNSGVGAPRPPSRHDPNQTIYSFKGADPSLLVGFTDRYSGAVSASLDQDYRSTPQIVGAANLADLLRGIRQLSVCTTETGQRWQSTVSRLRRIMPVIAGRRRLSFL